MHAHAGDWLVVPEVPGGAHARRGLIVAVSHADGSPPFRVRWLDDEHETLLFPPPDAQLQRHAAMPAEATRSRPVRGPRTNGSLVPSATDVRHWMQRALATRLVAGRSGPAVRRS